jgi:hypothetical protein
MHISSEDRRKLKSSLLVVMDDANHVRKNYKRRLPYYFDRDLKNLTNECAGLLVKLLDRKKLGGG